MPIKLCERCRRAHGGICGIPAGVSLGFGARLGEVRTSAVSGKSGRSKPRASHLSTKHLEAMLAIAREQYQLVLESVKIIPQAELLDREAKLSSLIKQLEGQIAARAG